MVQYESRKDIVGGLLFSGALGCYPAPSPAQHCASHLSLLMESQSLMGCVGWAELLRYASMTMEGVERSDVAVEIDLSQPLPFLSSLGPARCLTVAFWWRPSPLHMAATEIIKTD